MCCSYVCNIGIYFRLLFPTASPLFSELYPNEIYMQMNAVEKWKQGILQIIVQTNLYAPNYEINRSHHRFRMLPEALMTGQPFVS